MDFTFGGKKYKEQNSEQIGKGDGALRIPELVKLFISFGGNGQQACLMSEEPTAQRVCFRCAEDFWKSQADQSETTANGVKCTTGVVVLSRDEFVVRSSIRMSHRTGRVKVGVLCKKKKKRNSNSQTSLNSRI